MSTSDRDTHFAQFAKQQFEDVEGMFMDLASAKFVVGYEAEQAQIANDIQLFLARRAYDLACHVADELLGGSNPEYFIQGLPDMTELPEESTPKILGGSHRLDGKKIADEIKKMSEEQQ